VISQPAFTPRVIGVLVGDIEHQQSAYVKYGLFFEALNRRLPVVGVYDASLRGFNRVLNALLVANKDWNRWQQRYHKNVPAFRSRSRKVADYLNGIYGSADVILQVGVLFDARWSDPPLRSVIYTDYTAKLSAGIPAGGRSPFSEREKTRWIELERQAFQRASHILTRSDLVRDSIVKDYGLSPNRVTTVGAGLNLPVVPHVIQRSERPPTILFIGKEFFRKGGDILLRAFAMARSVFPDARLLLMTKQPPTGLSLEGVEIVPPTWDRAVVSALYRRSDIFVLPSRLETWGDVLLEAMSFGLPCIGVKGQAMEEIIRDGVTGILVPSEDTNALAAALVKLLRDRDFRERLGAAGRQRLENLFTWDRVTMRMIPALVAAANITVETR